MADRFKNNILTAIEYIASSGILAYAAILFAALFNVGEHFEWTQWTTRDLIRAKNLLCDFPFSGAEISFGPGLRTPGGALYYLMSIPMIFSSSPAVFYGFMVFLFLVSAVILFDLLRRYFGIFPAACGVWIYLACPITRTCMINLWNPGFSPLFAVAAYYFLLRAICEKKFSLVKWSTLNIAIGAQMHASLLLLLPAAVFTLYKAGRYQQHKRQWLRATAFFLIPYLPYLLHQALNAFPDKILWSGQQTINTSPTHWQCLLLLFINIRGYMHENMLFFRHIISFYCLVYIMYICLRPHSSSVPKNNIQGVYLSIWGTAPFIIFLLFGPLPPPISPQTEGRYLIGMVPAFAIVFAAAINHIKIFLKPRNLLIASGLYILVATDFIHQGPNIVTWMPPHSYAPEVYQKAKQLLPEYKDNLSGRMYVVCNDTGKGISSYALYDILKRNQPVLGSQNAQGLIIIPGQREKINKETLIKKHLKQNADDIVIQEEYIFLNTLFIKYTRT